MRDTRKRRDRSRLRSTTPARLAVLVLVVSCASPPPEFPTSVESTSSGSPDPSSSTSAADPSDGDISGDATTAAAASTDQSGGDTTRGSVPSCGNGVAEPGEACDGDDLAGQDCTTLGGAFTGGVLACSHTCTLDASGCDGCGVDPVPAATDCPIECSSCIDGTCTIECVGDEACLGGAVVCPEGWHCEVVCQGFDTCLGSTIVCPQQYGCTISCEGNSTCHDATILCGNGVCALTCLGRQEACDLLDMNCGPDACSATCEPGAGEPSLDCNASCACTPCN